MPRSDKRHFRFTCEIVGGAQFVPRHVMPLAHLAFLLLTFPLSRTSDSHELMKEVRYILPEEQAVGKVLGTIELWGSSPLSTTFNPGQPQQEGQTQFLFLRQQDFFTLDERTGTLKTSARIDREEICPNKKNCEMLLDVAVKNQHSTRIVRVTVTVIDLNDNAPEFAGEGRVLEIPESATVGSSFPVPLAFDKDSPEFGVRHYRMKSDDDDDDELTWFRLDTATSFGDHASDWLFGGQPHVLLYRGDRDNEQPKLTLVKSLDRETKDIHKLTIVAVDGGTPARSGTVDLTVIVKDVNDNVPTFEQSHYSTVIQENAPILTNVIQIRATDPDFDLNGQVVYSLFPSPHVQESSNAQQVFGIDSKSGEVYVKGSVDHEVTSTYKLIVVARDSGVEPSSSSALLAIHVTDVNDNPPEITVDTLSQTPGVAEAVEEMETGAFVAHVTVTDRDSGENGKTSCRLNSTERFRLIATTTRDDGGDYQIVTRSRLDREAVDRHLLGLVCHDSGAEQLTSSASVLVRVVDINDNPPTFERKIYAIQLTENNHVGDDVIGVVAVDPDEGLNGRVVYFIDEDQDHLSSLSSSSEQLFYVEPDTGAIKAAVSFDRERGSTVEFRVGAKDRGAHPLTGTAIVRVTIVDVNDESPRFSQSAYSFAVRENQPTGTEVGSVAAIDLDSDRFGEVTYSLQSGGSFGSPQQLSVLHLNSLSSPPLIPSQSHVGLFDINPRTGSIFTLRSLDREAQSSYHVLVRASDGGRPPKTSQCTVIIYVADENDNDPIFEYPSTSNSTLVVSNLAERRFIVARLRARDADFSGNARVTFSLLRETSYFLLVKVPDDFEVEDIPHSFFSSSSSSSSSFSSSNFDLLEDSDDHPESDKIGNIVDKASPKFFHVDRTLGILYLLDDLRHEDGKSFVLWFGVRDEGTPERSSTGRLIVLVNSSAPFPAPGQEEFFQETGGYFAGSSGPHGSHHFWIVLLLAVISGVVVIVLIVAIVVVCRQDDKRSSDRYNCRMESLKMIQPSGASKDNNLLDAELSDRDEKLNNKLTYNAKVKCSNATSLDAEEGTKESEEKLFKSMEECHDVIKVNNPYVEHRPVYSSFRPCSHQQSAANEAPSKPAKAIKCSEEGSLNSSGEGSNADSGRGCSDEGTSILIALSRLPNKNLNPTANQRAPYQSHDQPNNPSASNSQTTTILISPSLCEHNYTSVARSRLVSGVQYPAIKPGHTKTLNCDQIRSSNLKLQQFQQPQPSMASLGRCSTKHVEPQYRATREPGDKYHGTGTQFGVMGVKSSTPVLLYPGQVGGAKRQSHPQQHNKNHNMRWADNTEYKAAVGLNSAQFGSDAMMQSQMT